VATKIQRRSNIADRIKPIEDVESFITMLCYGKAGTGKTVFGCSFPKPLLLLDIREEGQDSVTDVAGVELLPILTWQDLEDIYWELESGNLKYQSVLIDQLTAMQSLGMQKIREENKQQPSDVFSQRSWGRLGGLMQTWVFNFRELKKKRMHICFNAHERIREAEETEDERLAPSVGANLTQGTATFVSGAVSIIGNSFIREEVDKKTKEKRTEFCMRVGPHAYYAAKIRRPVSAGPAPDVIVNPSFEKLLAITRGQSTPPKRLKP
jgi:hypothetical protein